MFLFHVDADILIAPYALPKDLEAAFRCGPSFLVRCLIQRTIRNASPCPTSHSSKLYDQRVQHRSIAETEWPIFA